MSAHPELDGLGKELNRLREKIDHLRLHASLGKMELKDKLGELTDQLEPACRDATQRLTRITRTGADEARTLAQSLQAGFDSLVRTHRELSRQAERERKNEREHERRS